MQEKRPCAIIQARMGSTRLPGKVLKPILGRPMLWYVVQRVRWAPGVTEVVVATSDQPNDEPVRSFCEENGIAVFAGSESDVLDRFYQAAVQYAGDPLIRVTGDCPFVDPQLIGRVLELFATGEYDHVGVATGAGTIFLEGGRFPDGLDAECFRFTALERAWREATELSDREHVTPYIWRVPGRFRLGLLKAEEDYSQLRWTVDNEADFALVAQAYEALYREDRPFLMADILRYLAEHPELAATNQAFIGQEGYLEVWRLGDS
jgi:spore coat polysaccharide biosynthesis protein SpsF